jgi:hypothetical protein
MQIIPVFCFKLKFVLYACKMIYLQVFFGTVYNFPEELVQADWVHFHSDFHRDQDDWSDY